MEYVKVQQARIPALGFGTFQIEDQDARRAVADAIDIGYRHIDTAQIYENEKGVGQGIAASGIDRDDLFLTTKVWIDQFEPDDLLRSTEQSLERLKTDQVDLLLLHWPNPQVDLADTVAGLNEARRRGWTRHIGISNFPTDLIRQAAALSEAPLAVNQVEYHPFLDQSAVKHELDSHGMGLTAYSPLARGRVFKDDTLEQIARRHGRSVSQVALRWLLDQDHVVAIPKASQKQHAADNFGVWDWQLDPQERQAISQLHQPDGRVIDPDFAPDWD